MPRLLGALSVLFILRTSLSYAADSHANQSLIRGNIVTSDSTIANRRLEIEVGRIARILAAN